MSGPGGQQGVMAAAGSQRQVQIYVNQRPAVLDGEIRGAFPELDGATLEWRSPLESDGFREYWDSAFLDAVGQAEHADALAKFWPKGGPHWDALAIVSRPGSRPGVILVEAKSHVSELLKGSAIAASVADSSRRQIELAMAWTHGSLGICDRSASSWCETPLYQSANRLAHLQWLNCRGADAWLVHVLFSGDAHVKAASRDEWESAVAEADRDLGVSSGLILRAGHIILPAIIDA